MFTANNDDDDDGMFISFMWGDFFIKYEEIIQQRILKIK